MQPKLSICIPTYNRAHTIKFAIESILQENSKEIEIIISDNCSTDETQEIIEDYCLKYRNIFYRRNPENFGADVNFLNAVEAASGIYCIIMGSDDAFDTGALTKLLAIIGKHDLYLMDRKNMSRDMKTVKCPHERFLTSRPMTVYNFADEESFLNYLGDCEGLGSLFSFISSIVFRRESWNMAPTHEALIGSLWIHVSKINEMQKSGCSMQYIGLPLILNRSDNDSFYQTLGFVRRRLLDLKFVKITDTVFHDSPGTRLNTRNIIARRFLSLRQMISDKRYAFLSEGNSGVNLLYEAYLDGYGDRLGVWVKIIFVRFLPVWVLEIGYKILKKGNSQESVT